MTAFASVLAVVFIGGGIWLMSYCIRRARREPGWLRMYGVSRLLLMLSLFAILLGLLQLRLALE